MSHSEERVVAPYGLESEAHPVGPGEATQDEAPRQPEDGINRRLVGPSKACKLVRRDVEINAGVDKPQFVR